uniref:PLOD1-3-like GT domain-containing protein n=1 Tax=viral metagenome TaxID=1070528 RepID=A0A6C0B823_9ZZZZ
MEDLHIVTVVNESKYYFPYLVESCKRNGKELEVLGLGETWTGFNFKYKKMADYLKTLPETDIVCFVDGFDVICTRDLIEIKEIFLKLKAETDCKMIVGDDKLVITEFLHFFSSLYFGNCNGEYLNSGTYIGYVKDLSEILNKILKANSSDDADDQRIMIEYCNRYPGEIYLDKNNKLFLALAYPGLELDSLFRINEDLVSYNNENPFFVHAMGGGYLENTIRKLGYSINDETKNKLFYDNIKKSFYLPYPRFIMFVILFYVFTIVYFLYFYSIHKIILKTIRRVPGFIAKID